MIAITPGRKHCRADVRLEPAAEAMQFDFTVVVDYEHRLVSIYSHKDFRPSAYATYFLPYLQRVEYLDPADNSSEEAYQTIDTLELHVNGTHRPSEVSGIGSGYHGAESRRFWRASEPGHESGTAAAGLTTLFGILVLTLASIGLYGVTANTVEQRTREIGIRVAVGANRANVLSMVLGGALRQVAVGLAIGIPLPLLSGWLISSQLFEVKGHDPIALTLAALMLAACALVAGLIPARRAASIDPMQALRRE